MAKHSINIDMCIERRQSPIGTYHPGYFSFSVLGCLCLSDVCCKAPDRSDDSLPSLASIGTRPAHSWFETLAGHEADDSCNGRDKLD
jgi:hypothetical protein